MECIVLAGGLGTRLQSVIGLHPKCMAPVNGKPFLHYLFQYLAGQGVEKVILSLGFKADEVLEWINAGQWPFNIEHVIETEPLGTGGGIRLAMGKATADDVVVLNGDTLYMTGIEEVFRLHKDTGSATTLALKEMQHFERYGVVNVDSNDVIISFEEKKNREQGLINGGVYIINKKQFAAKQLPEKFSFEKDYLERFVMEQSFYGYNSDAYFIDIGIPADYEKAGVDFKTIFG